MVDNPKVVPQDETITLEDITTGKYKSPLTLKDLYAFAKGELSEENIEFLVTLQQYKAKYETGEAWSEREKEALQQMLTAVELRGDSREEATKHILKTFILYGAEREVNIASSQKERLLEAAVQAEEGAITPDTLNKCSIVSVKGMFDESESEIAALVSRDTLPRFLKVVTTENINDAETSHKYILVYQFGAVSLLLLALLITLETFEVIPNRGARISIAPFVLLAVVQYEQAKRKV